MVREKNTIKVKSILKIPNLYILVLNRLIQFARETKQTTSSVIDLDLVNKVIRDRTVPRINL